MRERWDADFGGGGFGFGSGCGFWDCRWLRAGVQGEKLAARGDYGKDALQCRRIPPSLA